MLAVIAAGSSIRTPTLVAASREDIARLLELGAKLERAPHRRADLRAESQVSAECDTGRTPEEDEALWLEGLRRPPTRPSASAAEILVEPINRYENSVTVTVADAVRWAAAMDSPRVRADGRRLPHEHRGGGHGRRASRRPATSLAYVHLGDSQRLEPGQGHLDLDDVFGALHRIGYDGWATMECNLSGPADVVLPAAARFVRERIAATAPA